MDNDSIGFELGVSTDTKMNATLEKTNDILDNLSKNLQSIKSILVNTVKSVSTINTKFDDLNTTMSKLDNGTKSTSSEFQSMNKTMKNLQFNQLSKRITNTLKVLEGLTKPAIDYIEDLNLLKVAYGETGDAALDMIDSIARATGFDNASLVKGTATFRQLTSTLNATNEVADLLANNLSKMSLDISSLYNLDLSRSQYALQGALTGQPRSIKSATGADVTQAGIQATLSARGIDLEVKSLNQAEKAIATYLTLERQLINSNSDLARTIDQPSNSLRIFKEQLTALGRNIASLFIPILQAILPPLTAIVMVLNELITMLLSFFNIDTRGFWNSMSSGAYDFSDGINAGAEGAGKLAKELSGLRSFDKLNVINTPKQTSVSGISGAGSASINKQLQDALKEYDLHLENIQTRAQKIRDSIMEWLGFSKDVNGEWKFTHITLGTILGILTGAGGIVLTIAKVYNKTKGISDLLKGLGTIGSLGKTTETVGKTATNVGKLAKVGSALKSSGIVKYLTGLGKGLLAGFATFEGLKLGTTGIIKALGADLDYAEGKLKNVTEETKNSLKPINDAYSNISKTISEIDVTNIGVTSEDKKKIIGSIDGLMFEIQNKSDENLEKQKLNLQKLLTEGFITPDQYNQKIKELENYYDTQDKKTKEQNKKLKKKAEELFDDEGKLRADKYKEFIDMLNEFNGDTLTALTLNAEDRARIEEDTRNLSKRETLKYYSDLLTEYAKDRDEAIKKAEEKRDATVQAIKETYDKSDPEYQKLIDQANATYEKEKTSAENAYNDIYDSLATNVQGMSDFLDRDDGHLLSTWEYVSKKFHDDFVGAVDIVKSSLKSLVNGTWFTKLVNLFTGKKTIQIETVYSGGGNGSFGGGKSGSGGVRAEGGFVNTGEMFIAREAGPELVGRIGNRTAVANNDQIISGISDGVLNAILRAGGLGGSKQIVIQATGDTDGLMNFITFKQKENDMQFGD